MNKVAGISTRELSASTGIPMHTLQHWVRSGLITPSVRTRTASGRSMLWNYRDYVSVKILELIAAPRYRKIRKFVAPWISNVSLVNTLVIAHCGSRNPYRSMNADVPRTDTLMTDDVVMFVMSAADTPLETEYWLKDRDGTVVMELPVLQWAAEGQDLQYGNKVAVDA